MSNFQTRVREILTDPKSFATTLLVVSWDRYGTDLVNWSPAGILENLNQDFAMRIPRANFDRLMAAISIVTSDEFYQSPSAFIRLCNVLSGDEFDPRVWDPADGDEMAWGITEAMIIHPGEGHEPFSEKIRRYIGKVLDEEGVINPPDVLRLAIREKAVERVPSSFADDPEMFQAMWSSQNERTLEIKEIVRSNLQELLRQVITAPLVHGDVEDLVRRIQNGLHED